MKFTVDPPYADLEKAARRLLEHAQAFEVIWDGPIYIENINGPFLFGDKGTRAEYKAGLDLMLTRGRLEIHESGTFVRFAQHNALFCKDQRIATG